MVRYGEGAQAGMPLSPLLLIMEMVKELEGESLKGLS